MPPKREKGVEKTAVERETKMTATDAATNANAHTHTTISAHARDGQNAERFRVRCCVPIEKRRANQSTWRPIPHKQAQQAEKARGTGPKKTATEQGRWRRGAARRKQLQRPRRQRRSRGLA